VKNLKFIPAGALLTLCAAAPNAYATPLSASDSVQLQTWLGQGKINLTNIFTSGSNSTAHDFHAAADGMGATFTVMNVTQNAITKTIGGYNPKNWNSTSGYNEVDDPTQRIAFLFNLTDSIKYFQGLNSMGRFQTFNSGGYGPIFGGGFDIFVDANLKSGYTALVSYGNNLGASIVDGSHFYGQDTRINSIDVYTISAVPEPATYTTMLTGLIIFGFIARRRRKA